MRAIGQLVARVAAAEREPVGVAGRPHEAPLRERMGRAAPVERVLDDAALQFFRFHRAGEQR